MSLVYLIDNETRLVLPTTDWSSRLLANMHSAGLKIVLQPEANADHVEAQRDSVETERAQRIIDDFAPAH